MPNKYKDGTTYLYLRMPTELKRKLFEVAQVERVSATELARQALEKFLREEEKKFKNPLDR